MAIEYVEIRDESRNIVGIIDTAQSIIWHSVYNGVGDFEIYAQATEKHIGLLVAGNYVTRLNDAEIGIIEHIAVSFNVQSGRMITATGRFAKSILDRRHIYNLDGNTNKATVFSGNVEAAARKLVYDNAIGCLFDSMRNIPILELGALANLPEVIVDDNGNAASKQVSYANLLTYTDSLLDEYKQAAMIILDEDSKQLQYIVYKGADRSTDNTDGNAPIIFSQDFDNLNESEYTYDTAQEKTAALIGGEGEGLGRFYSLVAGAEIGLARRETWVDASAVSKKYKDEQGEEKTYSDAEYKQMLDTLAKQELAPLVKIETFSGSIDITEGQFILNQDFALGDIVTVQDNFLGKYINARVYETLETQDENGYTVEAVYR